MSTPPYARESSQQLVPAGSLPHGQDVGVDEIPRRMMRVKVLYTFDDQTKSNCLARLPNALPIPTVSLDEATQVGVIELRSCIQAIVAASPELVAKLGHDYTVYAYDYSEYETPLVGQGMLSWILASASSTPNAPAEESRTMVTGRVCKNIMGLFSNGIKETLEVKLKLVPVPTCMQKEYVENMERYHNLRQICPEDFDYNAWKEFLNSNPALSQLSQPIPNQKFQWNEQVPMQGGSMQQRQPHHSSIREGSRGPMFLDERSQSFNGHQTRPVSPAMSTASYNPYYGMQESRPTSRASFHSEAAPLLQRNHSFSDAMPHHNEEGPPKKRARVTKAKKPKNAPLVANNDSLRVAASTAASVRLHRPIATNPAADIAAAEQIPRAPTPRPGDARFAIARSLPRAPPPSLLRNASVDEGRRYVSPYDTSLFSDNAVDSADDERGPSPGETPMDIPSSPPVMPQRMESPAPSSPGLPTLPYPADSGFVSDLPESRADDTGDSQAKFSDIGDSPALLKPKTRAKQDRSRRDWVEVTPGPAERLPQTYIPKPKTYPRPGHAASTAEKAETDQEQPFPTPQQTTQEQNNLSELPKAAYPVAGHVAKALDFQPSKFAIKAGSPDEPVIKKGSPEESGMGAFSPPEDDIVFQGSRSATPNPPPMRTKNSKSRGLPRSHTWSGPEEPMSDAAGPETTSTNPRSGAGAKRKQCIVNKMKASIEAGKLPTHCNNCGEIETPTWRQAFTRLEPGLPAPIIANADGTGIIAVEFVAPEEGAPPQHRIFKSMLAKDEDSKLYTQLNLCNPCGLWLRKKCAMRPEALWQKKDNNLEKPKRKRNPPKNKSRKKIKGENDLMSDAMVPHSEPVMHDASGVPASTDGSADLHMQPPMRSRTSSFQFGSGNAGTQLNDSFAAAALQRAIQSSPAGFRRGSRDTPIDLEPDLTPKPTRRLLFPSPRKAGEIKSLGDFASVSPNERPLVRKTAESPIRLPDLDEDTDKENCPPSVSKDDDLAHLFEFGVSPKTTPTKGGPLQDLLKTPTPGSRRRNALTPRRGIENHGEPLHPPNTPSRQFRTPNRPTRGLTVPPVTPFTAQLNALLSDCVQPSSPSQTVDFSAFPTFMTPGRNYGELTVNFDFDLEGMGVADDFLSSDLPMPSSPPRSMNGGLDFSLYEDPDARGVGLWSGASMLGSDTLVGDTNVPETETEAATLKATEISVDFAEIIDRVVTDFGIEGFSTPFPVKPEHADEEAKSNGGPSPKTVIDQLPSPKALQEHESPRQSIEEPEAVDAATGDDTTKDSRGLLETTKTITSPDDKVTPVTPSDISQRSRPAVQLVAYDASPSPSPSPPPSTRPTVASISEPQQA